MNEGSMPQEWEVPFARLQGKVDAVADDTRRILKHLEGNGQVGLLTKVSLQDKAIEVLQRGDAEHAENSRWLWRTVIAALVVAAIGLAANAIKMQQSNHQQTEARP